MVFLQALGCISMDYTLGVLLHVLLNVSRLWRFVQIC